jgi:hypothetical protein
MADVTTSPRCPDGGCASGMPISRTLHGAKILAVAWPSTVRKDGAYWVGGIDLTHVGAVKHCQLGEICPLRVIPRNASYFFPETGKCSQG